MIAGVDGCKNGWIVAISDAWPPAARVDVTICPTFAQVLEFTQDADAVAIDIPIGLTPAQAGADWRRQADVEARNLLDAGASRVFFAPPHEAIGATSAPEFQDIHRRLTGQGAGLPVWGIVPKIAEVDSFMTPELQDRIFEFHPELTWMRMAGRVLDSKHTAAGIVQRVRLIAEQGFSLDQIDSSGALIHAAIDDFLDALAGLISASGRIAEPPSALRLPANSEQIGVGKLRMEIWY